jgi:predicted lipoprotein with Yx(FWY)xxD motif
MRNSLKVLIPALAATALLSACGSSSSSSTTSQAAAVKTSNGGSAATVKTAANATLGKTILVDAKGMTLYHLSGEQGGKFICASSACVHIWPPLTPQAGATPTGVAALGTVKRPDGTLQVTYKGEPLYTFVKDLAAGDAHGQGLKDVGTWSAVAAAASTSSAPAAPQPAPPATTKSAPPAASGGGYGY